MNMDKVGPEAAGPMVISQKLQQTSDRSPPKPQKINSSSFPKSPFPNPVLIKAGHEVFFIVAVGVTIFNYLPRSDQYRFAMTHKRLGEIYQENLFQPRLLKAFESPEEAPPKNDFELISYLGNRVLNPTKNKEDQPGRFAYALPQLKTFAEEGCPLAQLALGMLYLEGRLSDNRNYNEGQALKWLNMIEPKSAVVCNLLAGIYRESVDVRHYELAVLLYKKSIVLGSAAGYSGLAYMYRKGKHVTKNYKEAERLARIAADMGCADGFRNLALIYWNGQQLLERALTCFQKAIDIGCSHSSSDLKTLAEIFHNALSNGKTKQDGKDEIRRGLSLLNGWHVKQNIVQGEKVLQNAPHDYAAVALGEWFCWQFMCSVKRGSPNEEYRQKAIRYLSDANGRGFNGLRYSLGILHEAGPSESDQETACGYFEQAVIKDKDANAFKKLEAILLSWGKVAHDADAKEIYKRLVAAGISSEAYFQLARLAKKAGQKNVIYYLKAAAEAGHVKATYKLAKQYEQKLNEAVTETKSYWLNKTITWYKKAVAAGHAKAPDRLEMLSKDRDRSVVT